MSDIKHGCGMIFHDEAREKVLVFLRDDTPTIPFPNKLDLLGGGVEVGETPEVAIARELAEELRWKDTGVPYSLRMFQPFRSYIDRRGTTQHIFVSPLDFAINEIELLEGQHLLFVTRAELNKEDFAFDFDEVIAEFFNGTNVIS